MCKSPNDTDDHLNAILNCVSLHILLVLLHKVGETLQGKALSPSVLSGRAKHQNQNHAMLSHMCLPFTVPFPALLLGENYKAVRYAPLIPAHLRHSEPGLHTKALANQGYTVRPRLSEEEGGRA